jgi:predicted DNA-binding transcriptional regulator AlpA
MSRHLVRPKAVMARLGIKRTSFYANFAYRLRPVRLGPRCVAYVSDEVDALVDELAAGRDAQPARQPKPQRQRVFPPRRAAS